MGLLMSDSLPLDPLLDEVLRLLNGLSELAYATDATCDGHDHEAADLIEWPRLTVRQASVAADADPLLERSA
jgi:hypothetical protein